MLLGVSFLVFDSTIDGEVVCDTDIDLLTPFVLGTASSGELPPFGGGVGARPFTAVNDDEGT